MAMARKEERGPASRHMLTRIIISIDITFTSFKKNGDPQRE
jgi:hypothetical protein